MDTKLLLDSLAGYAALDATEQHSLDRMREFLRTTPAPFSRSTLEGHITGSAVLIDAPCSMMLMIWHEKLQRWLQPGGHCEPGEDADVQATALRELMEETGLPASSLKLASERPSMSMFTPSPPAQTNPTTFTTMCAFCLSWWASRTWAAPEAVRWCRANIRI
ncbi:MAG: NUDIX domain-containing protein [Anaerolineae bacterium]|nr:NUDIX domain-containing protein [Anaerolineae bacterium]